MYNATSTSLSARLGHPSSREAALAEVQAARRETLAMTAAILGVTEATLRRWCDQDAEVARLVRAKA